MIHFRTLRAALFMVILIAATSGETAVDDLTDVVPTGAPVVYYVTDIPGAVAQWKNSPLAGLWNDPQVQTFFAPLRDELEVERWSEMVRKETGHELDEIMKMFTGDLVVYLEDFSFVLDEGAEDVDFSVAMLARVGENAATLEKLILEQQEKLAEDDEEEAEQDDSESTHEIREFRGIDLHVESVFSKEELTRETGWAMVDGVWAFASPIESLERAVAGILDGGADDPLRSGTNFATVSSHTRKADSWVFIDIDPWVPMIRSAIEEGLAAAQEAGSPFPVDPAALMEALGIEAMQALFATLEFEDQKMGMDFGLTYTENRGLVKLLAYGPEAAPRSTFIPVDSDSFTAAYFDFGGAWSAIVEIMNGINPALMGMAAMQLQSMAQQAGAELDLRRDLLENLTGEMVSIQNMDGLIGDSLAELQLEQDQVFVLGINQKDALENAIETIKGMVGQGSQFFNERDFEGHTIFTLDLPQAEGEAPGTEIAYVVRDNHLLLSVGSPATLEKVLLKFGAKGKSVWLLPPVQRALGQLPDGGAALQFQDLTSIGDLVFNAIALADDVKTEDGEDFRICDPSAVPDSGTVGKYFSSGVSGVWKDDRRLVIRSLILPADRD